jgi:hypothetical protein
MTGSFTGMTAFIAGTNPFITGAVRYDRRDEAGADNGC